MTIRLGLIGCGLISHAHGRAASKSGPHIRFGACASRSIERAREWASLYGCDRAYDDHREMLRHEALDGVVIATWPTEHRRHIEDCIDAGVRFVLCEKALAPSGADALAIFLKARAAGAAVMEGFMYRHNEVMKAISSLLPKLGRIDYIHGTFNMWDAEESAADDPSRSWRQRSESGGGVPFDFACYPIDAANLFAASVPVRVQASADTSARYGTIDRLYGLVEYANGCRASFESSRRAPYSQALVISGAAGRLHVPIAWTPLGPVTITLTSSSRFLALGDEQVRTGGEEVERLIDLPVFRRQLQNFAAVIRGAELPKVTALESLTNALVLDAALESARTGRSIRVEMPERTDRFS